MNTTTESGQKFISLELAQKLVTGESRSTQIPTARQMAGYHESPPQQDPRKLAKKLSNAAVTTQEIQQPLLDTMLQRSLKAYLTNIVDPEQGQHLDEAKKALQQGASPDVKNENNYYYIHSFAALGDTKALQVLIDAKADIDLPDERNMQQTPLMRAAYNGKVAAVKLLLKAGADVQVKDKSGKTALMLVEEKNEKSNNKDLNQIVKLIKEAKAA